MIASKAKQSHCGSSPRRPYVARRYAAALYLRGLRFRLGDRQPDAMLSR